MAEILPRRETVEGVVTADGVEPRSVGADRIERRFAPLKDWRRTVTRNGKLARNFLTILTIVTIITPNASPNGGARAYIHGRDYGGPNMPIYKRAHMGIIAAIITIAPFSPFLGAALADTATCGGASYYHDKFSGKSTASGEAYDPTKMTAAHRSLPFGSEIRVSRDDDSNRSVIVRINDRGPFTRNRLIDLSRAAARQLGMLRAGVARVCLAEITDRED